MTDLAIQLLLALVIAPAALAPLFHLAKRWQRPDHPPHAPRAARKK